LPFTIPPAVGARRLRPQSSSRSAWSRAPDLLILYQGRLYALELKTVHGRLTATQSETQERMRAAGATVTTAGGIDAALECLEAWGLLRLNVAKQLAEAI